MTIASTEAHRRPAETRWALEASGLDKSFGGVPALRQAGLSVAAGTIHALLGGNGSGKSTLIKCIAGVYTADAGTITVHGTPMTATAMTPRAARGTGLRFVHQDLGVFDSLTVAENLALGDGFPTTAWRGIRWRELHERAAEVLARFDIRANPRDRLGALRPSQQTMVAIARALADQQESEHILILDEPTASLPEHESTELMQALRRRADHGQTIVLVSHRFREIEAFADEITVFRDGEVAGTGPTTEMPSARVVDLMTGSARPAGGTAGVRAAATAAIAATDSARGSGERVLTATALVAGPLAGVDVSVDPGQIVGLAGLAGSGRSSVLRAVFGDLPLASGEMQLLGHPHHPASPGAAVAAGIAMVPENRARDSAFLDMSLRENATMTRIGRYWRRGVMDRRSEQEDTGSLISHYAIRAAGTELPLSSLSGGNQQKVILARWLQQEPQLLLLDEPTQGVDIVSRRDIYDSLRRTAADGCAILVASSDLDELMELCDRILVLTDGHVTAEFPTQDLRREELASAVLTGAPVRDVKGTDQT